MDAKVTFKKDEIEGFCKDEAEDRFGKSVHEGFHWVATLKYSGTECDVELIADEPAQKAELVAPAPAPAPEPF